MGVPPVAWDPGTFYPDGDVIENTGGTPVAHSRHKGWLPLTSPTTPSSPGHALPASWAGWPWREPLEIFWSVQRASRLLFRKLHRRDAGGTLQT